MPYETVWVPPELFMTQAGINVFYTYKDDDIEQGQCRYWFTTSIYGDNGDVVFDVRELDSAHLLDQHPPFLQGENNTPENRAAWERWHEVDEPDTIRAIIAASIDAGLIRMPALAVDNVIPEPDDDN